MKAFHRFRLLVLCVGFLATTPSVLAQPGQGLFVAMAPEASAIALRQEPGPSAAIVTRSVVGMLLDQIFSNGTAAPALRLNVDTHDWVARFQRVDIDTVTGFRSWVGAIDGVPHSHVVFTERDGIVSGLINAVGLTYRIRTRAPGVYFLEQVDTHQLGIEGEPLVGFGELGPADARAGADDGARIDVLMLYTPAAESAAGGGGQILSLVSQIISDTNTIFANSGVIPRVRLVGASTLAFTESADLSADLTALTNSETARALRDSTGADLVQLLVDSSDPTVTGHARILGTAGATDFDAYSVAKVGTVAAYTPTHEMSHNMGADHAPEDGPTGGAFAYSRGYKDPLRRFRTVMAHDCPAPGCPRIAHLSNPLITFQGNATGSAAQNNTLSINIAAFTVANWRQEVPGPSTPPSAPTTLQTHVSGTTVAFQWSLSPWATNYTVQLGTAPGLADVAVAPVGQVFSVEGSLGLGSYYWRVVAANAHGTAMSAEAQVSVTSTCGVTTAPRALGATVVGGHVTLAWSPPILGAVSTYVVEAGSSSGAANLYNAPVGHQPTAQAFVPPGWYFVRMRALNACGISTPSNEILVHVDSTGGGAPAQPQDLRITLTTSLVTADWRLAAGSVPPDAFIIEAGSAPGLADQAIIEVGGQTNSFTTARPAPGHYYVRVKARSGALLGPATPDVVLVVP
jgi:hypothetical protein